VSDKITHYIVEVRHDVDGRGHNAQRATCLSCGKVVHPFTLGTVVNVEGSIHTCDPFTHEAWREVVRDCFLAGNDAAAIQIICHELNLVPP
jgi:hypothetical protein